MKQFSGIVVGVLATLCVLAPIAMAGNGVGAGGFNAFPSTSVNGSPLTVSSLTITSPGDLTLGVASDIILGNDATSAIRNAVGGNAILRMDDGVGIYAAYGSNSDLTMSSVNTTLRNAAGTTIITGDTTSPAKAAFRITPQDAPPSGAAVVGDFYVTTAGVLKICVTAGTPCGSWVSVGAQ